MKGLRSWISLRKDKASNRALYHLEEGANEKAAIEAGKVRALTDLLDFMNKELISNIQGNEED